MATRGRGPVPKETRQRADKSPKLEQVPITHDKLYGPPLPRQVNGEPWHPQTKKWWDAWRRFPLMADQPDLAWADLLDAALMHHRIWEHGELKHADELRRRTELYGRTPGDRLRMGVKLVPDAAKAVKPTAGAATPADELKSRRDRLTS